jgi:phospholipid transport system transporter-binding protein
VGDGTPITPGGVLDGGIPFGIMSTPVIDLAGVTDSDSSGLALLIEWLSVAKAAQRSLRYENMPAQLHQLAGLSEVEGLFTAA